MRTKQSPESKKASVEFLQAESGVPNGGWESTVLQGHGIIFQTVPGESQDWLEAPAPLSILQRAVEQ